MPSVLRKIHCSHISSCFGVRADVGSCPDILADVDRIPRPDAALRANTLTAPASLQLSNPLGRLLLKHNLGQADITNYNQSRDEQRHFR
jgi:hypothetical protein